MAAEVGTTGGRLPSCRPNHRLSLTLDLAPDHFDELTKLRGLAQASPRTQLISSLEVIGIGRCREDDHRNLRQPFPFGHPLEDIEPRGIGQPEVEYDQGRERVIVDVVFVRHPLPTQIPLRALATEGHMDSGLLQAAREYRLDHSYVIRIVLDHQDRRLVYRPSSESSLRERSTESSEASPRSVRQPSRSKNEWTLKYMPPQLVRTTSFFAN